jgi:ATP-dependent RNA helicase RhlE
MYQKGNNFSRAKSNFRPRTSSSSRGHSVGHSNSSHNSQASSHSSSRPSFGGGHSSGGRKFGGGRSGGQRFGGNGGRSGGSRGGGRGGRKSERIDVSRFVCKAVEETNPEIFVPEHKFSDFLIHDKIKNTIKVKGFEIPTPIQDKAIPDVLKGSDVVGIANTGTGKTAAFLIPLLNKVIYNNREKILIIVPTRELAIQIDDDLKTLSRGLNIFGVVCVGGMNIGPQMAKLRYGYNFIIGTPGRLKDLINRKKINLAEFNSVVLDEADRMLDMGFIGDMRYVMALMPKNRQTLFFSATMSPDIQKLIGEFLNNPILISVKKRDTAKNVDQDVVCVTRDQNKIDVLHELLNQNDFCKVLIFGRTKRGVEKLSRDLIRKGFKVDSIHGDKNHSKRQRALNDFKKDQIAILVATDVAARGLDIPDVSHVINYDIPETHDDYVHRIGRTGRGNKKGKALTFVDHGHLSKGK